MTIAHGQKANGELAPLRVNDAGELVVSSSGGGGGGGHSGLTDAQLRAAPVVTTGPAYAQIIQEPDAATTYICEAPVGTASSASAWRVQRIVKTGATTQIRWAGSGAFDQVADNFASLTYA